MRAAEGRRSGWGDGAPKPKLGHAHSQTPVTPMCFDLHTPPPGPPNRTPFAAPRDQPRPTAFPGHDDHATCRASGVWSLTHGHIFSKQQHHHSPPRQQRHTSSNCGLFCCTPSVESTALCWLRTPQTRRDEPGDVQEQHWSHRGPHATPRPSVASSTHRQPSHVPAAAAKSRPIGRSEAGPRQRERIPWIGAPPLTAASCNAGRASTPGISVPRCHGARNGVHCGH